jgi:opacity protein-like surface antigen
MRANGVLQFTVLLVSLGAVCTHARADTRNWYFGLKAGIGETAITQITSHGSIGTGLIVQGERDGAIRDTRNYDYPVLVSASLGRELASWRLEAEYTWSYRMDWDNRFATPSIQTITNVFANVETHRFLVNLVRRGNMGKRWSWELGAGIGAVANHADATYIERAIEDVAPERQFTDKHLRIDLAYNYIAGVSRALGEAWTMNIRYRYIDLGDLETGPFSGPTGRRESKLYAKQSSQEVQVSMEYRF